MDSYALGVKFYPAVESISEAVRGLGGETCDKVGIDIIEAHLSCQLKGFYGVLARVLSADDFQHLVVEGLRVYGDTSCTESLYHSQLLLGDCIWASCLNAVLSHLIKVEISLHSLHDSTELLC